jgi:hypothetical protein
MSIIKTSTFPKGKHYQLKQGEIVQLLQANGRFRDCYVTDLMDGDEYFMPEGIVPPRTDSDRVAFINKGRYDIDFSRASETCDIYDNETASTVFEDFETWTEAVDALMDLHEQGGVE